MLKNFSPQRDVTWHRQVGTSVMECHYAAGCISQPLNNITTLSITVDTFFAIPFMSGHGGVIDKLTFEVTTVGTAGSVARSGIYTNKSDNSEMYPDQLFVDSNEFNTAAAGGTGAKAASPSSKTLAPNSLYWFVLLSGTAAPTVRALTTNVASSLMGYPSTIGTTIRTSLRVAQAYGALPSTFPASATPTAGVIPLITVSFSSL